MTTIYRARQIVTMNPSRPQGTYVAVKDGRILGVGDSEMLAAWGDYTLKEDFATKVLLPGFVEGHAHAMEGGIWDFPYVGYQSRYDPEGNLWQGAEDLDQVIAVLKRAEAAMPDKDTPLFAWGFDPIYFNGSRMTTQHLDQVSDQRMIVVLHSNGHLLNANSTILRQAGITRETNVHGILKDENGEPTGELMEMAAQYMAFKQTGNPFFRAIDLAGLLRYAKSSCNVGVTTATDLFATFNDDTLAAYQAASQHRDFSLRIAPAMNTLDSPFDEGIMRVKNAMTQGNDKLYYGLCKVMTDGSIQGFTGRMKWPGYHNGAPNGVWNMPPAQLAELVMAYHQSGLHLHIHTNGDEASELMINAIERALDATPRVDHRHTLQHCQMADTAQFRRMKKLGICANLFANHVYYWGDQHMSITMGPERASRLDACRTAIDNSVPLAIHSDAPVTPLDPLFTMWCAVNRLTMSGKVLGENERLNVIEALHAVTLGAAYTLKKDHLVGSIESGKFADFAVLEENPLTVDSQEIKNIPVWGTVVGGVVYQAAQRA